jgi:F-type H+-transporting ATPase subunit delta
MSTYTDTLAKIYAKSLFEMATAAGGDRAVEETVDELEQIVAGYSNPAIEGLFSPGLLAKARRHDLLKQAFGGKITDLTLRFLLVLNANDRLSHFRPVVGAFRQLLEQARGRMEVEVITAGALGDEQLSMLKQKIQAVLGREPLIQQSVEPAMIGGLKVKIGDRLIDGSVSGRLRRMRHSLLTNGDAAIRLKAGAIAG